MKKQIRTKPRIDQNTEHFRSLGLSKGESRIDVIRDAARARARQLSRQAHPATIDLHRAEIAVAAYKLLDPRGRNDLYERVQLSCPIDQIDRMPPPLPSISPINRRLEQSEAGSEPAGNSVAIRIMDGSAVEQAIEQTNEEETESEPEGGDLSLDDRRNVVRLLRELEDLHTPSWTAIGWIRSKLGI